MSQARPNTAKTLGSILGCKGAQSSWSIIAPPSHAYRASTASYKGMLIADKNHSLDEFLQTLRGTKGYCCSKRNFRVL
jgi:hypothetical protein